METEEFRLIASSIEKLDSDTKEARQILETTYNSIQEIFQRLKFSSTFQGQARNELLGYLDLLQQYHGSLIGKDSDFNPTKSAEEGIEELIENMNNYYDKCVVYKSLEEIS